MHYYQFNIGDYRRDTTHLSLLEHGIYRSLLDSYYLNEKPLCEDVANLMRTHCVRTREEKEAFKNVLQDFFELTRKGYIHKKCDEQINKYNEKSEKARASAKARWGAKAMRTHSDGNTNHKPITNNHKPIKENNKKKVSPKLDFTSWPNTPSDQILTDWKKLRSRLKANVTQTVINRMGKELNKAKDMGYSVDECLSECVFKGWRGFEAGWLKSKPCSFKTDSGEPF